VDRAAGSLGARVDGRIEARTGKGPDRREAPQLWGAELRSPLLSGLAFSSHGPRARAGLRLARGTAWALSRELGAFRRVSRRWARSIGGIGAFWPTVSIQKGGSTTARQDLDMGTTSTVEAGGARRRGQGLRCWGGGHSAHPRAPPRTRSRKSTGREGTKRRCAPPPNSGAPPLRSTVVGLMSTRGALESAGLGDVSRAAGEAPSAGRQKRGVRELGHCGSGRGGQPRKGMTSLGHLFIVARLAQPDLYDFHG